MTRKLWVFIWSFMIVTVLFSGCNTAQNSSSKASRVEQDDKGIKNELLNAEGSKLQYGEEEFTIPEEMDGIIGQNEEGKLTIQKSEEDGIGIYSLEDDKSWKKQDFISYKYVEDEKFERRIFLSADHNGIYIMWPNEKNEICVTELSLEGEERNTISLSDEAGPFLQTQEWYFYINRTEKGDYVIKPSGILETMIFDGKTGKKKRTLSRDAQSFQIIGNDVIYNMGAENDRYIYVCDVDTGEIKDKISYPMSKSRSSIYCDEQGYYVFNDNGIQFCEKQGTEWQTIVDPKDTYFSKPDVFVTEAYKLPDNSFFVSGIANLDESKTYTYLYIPGGKKKPAAEKEVTILMLDNLPSLNNIVDIYEKKHPEVRVNIEIKDRDLSMEEFKKQLNTELLAGKGPDMIILDLLDIQNYMDKGILADLSDIGQKYINEKKGYQSIIETYKQDDKLYAIPLRFNMFMLCGNEEILKGGGSLENLVAYKKAHPEKELFNRNMIGLARQLSYITQPLLQDEEGRFDRKKAEEYVKMLEIISDPQGKNEELEMILCEDAKYKEMLDVAEHKAEVTLLQVRHLDDIACIDAVLDARADGTAVPLEMNGKIIYNVSGIMGINANSKNQEIMKEIINIALSDDNQSIANYLGMPPSEHDIELQEQYADQHRNKISDDTGRSITVDDDMSRIYAGCKESWEKASLCCNETNTINVEVLEAIKKYCEKDEDINSLLDAIEKRQELQANN